MSVTLKGLAWDHRRCWGPLDASIPEWQAAHPDHEIHWDRRSLYEFGEGRLDEAVKTHDLVIFDHPFVGEVARDGLLVPLDDYLTDEMRQAFEADSVGKSWRSYQAGGHQWALPIDAASQVAAYRPDLMANFADRAPRSHEDVVALGRRLTASGKWLGLPLVPTDSMCLVLTGAASAGHTINVSPEVFMADDTVAEVIDRLRELVPLVHPLSWTWNPINCFEHMIHNDDVVYVPFAFGYVNYASRTEEPHLRFADIPVTPPHGALLGGAGIGVSAFCEDRDAAIAYAIHLSSPDYQRGEYVTAGGQPGSLTAWTDPEANRQTRDFFKDTLATLQGAYLRNTHPGFVDFLRGGSHQCAAAIRGDLSARELAAWFNARHAETLRRNARDEAAV